MRERVIWVAAILAVSMVLWSANATAAKRVALVVGNAAYQHAPPLANPKNDAADVGSLLKGLGFEVIEGFDLDKPAFDRRLREFAESLEGAAAAVFFYAGHGLQVAGQNYLVPVEAQLATASALEFEAVRLDLVHRLMESHTTTNILFVDACRNNPLARNLARAMGTRGVEIGRGLAAVEAGVGTLVSFSTQPGNVALDGTGRNSPFTSALVRQVRASNEDLSAILIAVRNDVMSATRGKQVPWEHSALTGRFYFGDAPVPQGTAVSSSAAEWARVDKSSIIEIEIFLKRHPESAEAEYAKARRAELRKSRGRDSEPPAASPTSWGPPAPAGSEKSRVVGFTYKTPPQEVDPGLRVFKRHADGTWTNTYPSGNVDRSREQARIVLDGCTGTVIGDASFVVFIADKTCPSKTLRFKRGSGPWVNFGLMENVR